MPGLAGLAESLQMEIEPLGLRSICFEPGYFRTNFLSDENRGAVKDRISDYHDVHENRIRAFGSTQFPSPVSR